MNRYSLIFAALVAASFAVHPTRSGDTATRTTGEKKPPQKRHGVEVTEPTAFVQGFLAKAGPTAAGAQDFPQVLFVMVPHPTETHLASAFDHNVDALQDGLQAVGYLYDSSLIPWKSHEPRDAFDDDVKENAARKQEDGLPGVLLFRNNRADQNPYAKGIIAFLIAEKPTEGIAIPQIDAALRILTDAGVPFSGQIRLLGPDYSGSFPSLTAAVELLHQHNPTADILIRSGGVTAGGEAREVICHLSSRMKGTKIDFGSVHHAYEDWLRTGVTLLDQMNIDKKHIAILSEGESLYGGLYESVVRNNVGHDANQIVIAGDCGLAAGLDTSWQGLGGMWSLAFPRDISSVRSGYESQGLFESQTPAQAWTRSLTLKSDDQNDGDTVHSFGGADTVAMHESVLFGISEFVKKHEIRAVIISATNEEDRYFLSQFLHANNSGVRVIVIGNTRLFMRGSTSQFRGDLMIDDFPLMPLLHDWTTAGDSRVARIFVDDVAEGVYFSAIDMFADEPKLFRWPAEYSEPNWNPQGDPGLYPPMYVSALGTDVTWPVAEDAKAPLSLRQNWGDETKPRTTESALPLNRAQGKQSLSGDAGFWQLGMPFTLYEHNRLSYKIAPPAPAPPAGAQIPVARSWRALFGVVIGLVAVYCGCFCYANPIAHSILGSFDPSPFPRFWVFKVAIPAASAGCVFLFLAWAVRIPEIASAEAVSCWHWSEGFSVLAPLAIALTALGKAMKTRRGWPEGILWIPFAPPAIAFILLFPAGFFSIDPFSNHTVAQILNTYREMHWESGLSLVPTVVLLLLGFLCWSSEAGGGAALMATLPPLPEFPNNARISQSRAEIIASIGRPWPAFSKTKWLWLVWIAVSLIVLVGHFTLQPFLVITTLESIWITRLVFLISGSLTTLIMLDMLQFLSLWIELRGLLQALEREPFKRSFVPICDFNWRSLWTFTGVSFHSRRAINASMIDCMRDLSRESQFQDLEFTAESLVNLQTRYNTDDLNKVDRAVYRKDYQEFFGSIARVGSSIAAILTQHEEARSAPEPVVDPKDAAAVPCDTAGGRFKAENNEVACLPTWQQQAERFLCLMYIAFIQTVVARLHSLLVSVAAVFSLMVMAVAIYPFVPFAPLLLAGLVLLLLIAWAFFKVFSEMDTNAILARIVNSDDRKLQGNFYFKFAEALALPLLTLGSSLLPGGTGRLLELAQTLFNHGQ